MAVDREKALRLLEAREKSGNLSNEHKLILENLRKRIGATSSDGASVESQPSPKPQDAAAPSVTPGSTEPSFTDLVRRSLDPTIDVLGLRGPLALSEQVGKAGKTIAEEIEEAKSLIGRGRDETAIGTIEQVIPRNFRPSYQSERFLEDLQLFIPQNQFEAFIDLFGGGLTGPAVDVAAAGVKRLARDIPPHAARMLEVARANGVEMLPSDAKKGISDGLEKLLDASPFTADVIREFRDNQLKALAGFRDRIAKKIGGGSGSIVAGESYQEGVKEFSKIWRDESDKLYAKARAVTPQDAKADVTDLVNFSRRVLAGRGSDVVQKNADLLATAQRISELSKSKEAFLRRRILESQKAKGQFPEGLTERQEQIVKRAASGPFFVNYSTLSKWRQQLLAAWVQEDAIFKFGAPGLKGVSSKKAGSFGKMFGLADKSEKRFLERLPDGEAKDAISMARAFFKDGKAIFNDKEIQKLLKPEKAGQFINQLFRPRNGNVIRVAKKALPVKQWEDVRRTFVDKLIEGREFEGLLADSAPSYSPQRLAKALSQFDEDTLRVIFKDSELAEIRDLAELGNAISDANLRNMNTSRTASPLLAFLGAAVTFMDPTTGAVVIIGSRGLAHLYTSKTGRDLLIQGLTINPSQSQKEAAKWFTQMSALLTARLGRKLGAEETK